jgi:hypothetical protein
VRGIAGLPRCSVRRDYFEFFFSETVADVVFIAGMDVADLVDEVGGDLE